MLGKSTMREVDTEGTYALQDQLLHHLRLIAGRSQGGNDLGQQEVHFLSHGFYPSQIVTISTASELRGSPVAVSVMEFRGIEKGLLEDFIRL